MDFKTADLCDEFEQSVGVAEPLLRDYGGNKSFYGSLTTVKVFEDNVLVRETLETDGQGRVWSWTAVDLRGALWWGTGSRSSPTRTAGRE